MARSDRDENYVCANSHFREHESFCRARHGNAPGWKHARVCIYILFAKRERSGRDVPWAAAVRIKLKRRANERTNAFSLYLVKCSLGKRNSPGSWAKRSAERYTPESNFIMLARFIELHFSLSGCCHCSAEMNRRNDSGCNQNNANYVCSSSLLFQSTQT